MFSRPVLIGRGLGIFLPHARARSGVLEGARQHIRTTEQVSGGNCGGETPVPIPNTEVKTASADGTWGETPWESRSPPDFRQRPRRASASAAAGALLCGVGTITPAQLRFEDHGRRPTPPRPPSGSGRPPARRPADPARRASGPRQGNGSKATAATGKSAHPERGRSGGDGRPSSGGRSSRVVGRGQGRAGAATRPPAGAREAVVTHDAGPVRPRATAATRVVRGGAATAVLRRAASSGRSSGRSTDRTGQKRGSRGGPAPEAHLAGEAHRRFRPVPQGRRRRARPAPPRRRGSSRSARTRDARRCAPSASGQARRGQAVTEDRRPRRRRRPGAVAGAAPPTSSRRSPGSPAATPTASSSASWTRPTPSPTTVSARRCGCCARCATRSPTRPASASSSGSVSTGWATTTRRRRSSRPTPS